MASELLINGWGQPIQMMIDYFWLKVGICGLYFDNYVWRIFNRWMSLVEIIRSVLNSRFSPTGEHIFMQLNSQ